MKNIVKEVVKSVLFTLTIAGMVYIVFGLYASTVGHPIW